MCLLEGHRELHLCAVCPRMSQKSYRVALRARRETPPLRHSMTEHLQGQHHCPTQQDCVFSEHVLLKQAVASVLSRLAILLFPIKYY